MSIKSRSLTAKRVWLLALALFFCPFLSQAQLLDLSVQDARARRFPLHGIAERPVTVFIFMSPACPLCENYSVTLRNLRQQFPEEKVAIFGVFSGGVYPRDEITAYLARFKPEVTVLLDPDYKLRDHFRPKVTPEVVVVDRQGELQYQGKIDNWIAELGRTRRQPSRHYLKDAITAVLEGHQPEVTRTEAIGCVIE